MPRLRALRRPTSPVGLALTLFELWRRLPPKQRKQVMTAARKHGPRVASSVLKANRRRRGL